MDGTMARKRHKPEEIVGHCQTNGKRHSLLDAAHAERWCRPLILRRFSGLGTPKKSAKNGYTSLLPVGLTVPGGLVDGEGRSRGQRLTRYPAIKWIMICR
jgi:hypothetical protein